MPMQRRGRYHALGARRTTVLRCKSLQPPMSQMGQRRRSSAVQPSLAMSAAPSHSGHKADPERPPVGANSRPEQVQQTEQAYSITSSTTASSDGGTSCPIRVLGFQVFRPVFGPELSSLPPSLLPLLLGEVG